MAFRQRRSHVTRTSTKLVLVSRQNYTQHSFPSFAESYLTVCSVNLAAAAWRIFRSKQVSGLRCSSFVNFLIPKVVSFQFPFLHAD